MLKFFTKHVFSLTTQNMSFGNLGIVLMGNEEDAILSC